MTVSLNNGDVVREALVRRIERRLKHASSTSLTLELTFTPGGVERIAVPLARDDSGYLGLSTLERTPWRVFVLVLDGQSDSLMLRARGKPSQR